MQPTLEAVKMFHGKWPMSSYTSSFTSGPDYLKDIYMIVTDITAPAHLHLAERHDVMVPQTT